MYGEEHEERVKKKRQIIRNIQLSVAFRLLAIAHSMTNRFKLHCRKEEVSLLLRLQRENESEMADRSLPCTLVDGSRHSTDLNHFLSVVLFDTLTLI